MKTEERIITLNVNINMFNTLIAGLEELPHKFSRAVIDEISKQAQQQLQQNVPQGPLSDKVI